MALGRPRAVAIALASLACGALAGLAGAPAIAAPAAPDTASRADFDWRPLPWSRPGCPSGPWRIRCPERWL